jgi:hypothetical protein
VWTSSNPTNAAVLPCAPATSLPGRIRSAPLPSRSRSSFAQDQWLRLAGHDLATDFDLDPFTLLAKTKCLY